MNKRITALFLAVFAAVSLFGCGKAKEPLPDTLRFFNAAYAPITERNGGDYNLVGGYNPKNSADAAMIQKGLKSSWEVTDAATAKETMDWLLSEGHNGEVVQYYKDNELDAYSRSELESVLVEPDFTTEERVMYLCVYDAVQKFGDKAILAWDLSRAEQLLGWYYVAGYYTYEEAMDQSLEVAKKLQESYSSWDEMMESYFFGYQYWAEESMDDSDTEAAKRYEMYQELKAKEDGPYTVDWNTTLQKEW